MRGTVVRLGLATLVLHLVLIQPNHPAAMAWDALLLFPLELPVILSVKLIVHPLIVLMLLNWMGGVEPAWVATAVLMACLPPAANVFVIAQQYHVYIQRASSSILIGTIASTITVSIFIYLITEGLLPLQ